MFANQVIKSFKKQIKAGVSDPLLLSNMKTILLESEIESAVKYHLGTDDMARFMRMQAAKMPKKTQAFTGAAAVEVKLPYDNCWFDFVDTTFLARIHSRLEGVSLKGGLLVKKINPDSHKDEPEILAITPMFTYGGLGVWCFADHAYYIKVGENFTYFESESLYRRIITDMSDSPAMKKVIMDATNYNLISAPLTNQVIDNAFTDKEKFWRSTCLVLGQVAISYLNTFLMILNCKNVVTKDVSLTRTTPKGKVKKFKGMTYKILKFKLPKKSKKYLHSNISESNGDDETLAPLTTCSGHYKTYTEEAPLFGKVVGRWWWHSHARGKEENGVIDKDYEPDFDN